MEFHCHYSVRTANEIDHVIILIISVTVLPLPTMQSSIADKN